MIDPTQGSGYGFFLNHRVPRQVSWVFDFSYFFLKPAWFQPRISWLPDRSARPGQVLKLCILVHKNITLFIYLIPIVLVKVYFGALLFYISHYGP